MLCQTEPRALVRWTLNAAMLASCSSSLCCFELTKAKSGFWKASGSECLVEPRKNLWQAQQASCFILPSLKCWRGQWPISAQARRRGNYQRMSLGYMKWRICCDLWLNNQSRLMEVDGGSLEHHLKRWLFSEWTLKADPHSLPRERTCFLKSITSSVKGQWLFEGHFLVGRAGYINQNLLPSAKHLTS